MGRSERNQLTNRLALLLTHLLKWRFQPALRGNSWRLTIREQRRRASRVLDQNPSLRASLDTILTDAYGDALLAAQRETGLPEDAFPAECPWTFDQAMQDEL
jgi:ribosomal protein L29